MDGVVMSDRKPRSGWDDFIQALGRGLYSGYESVAENPYLNHSETIDRLYEGAKDVYEGAKDFYEESNLYGLGWADAIVARGLEGWAGAKADAEREAAIADWLHEIKKDAGLESRPPSTPFPSTPFEAARAAAELPWPLDSVPTVLEAVGLVDSEAEPKPEVMTNQTVGDGQPTVGDGLGPNTKERVLLDRVPADQPPPAEPEAAWTWGSVLKSLGRGLDNAASSGALGHAFRQAGIIAAGANRLSSEEAQKLLMAGAQGFRKNLNEQQAVEAEVELAKSLDESKKEEVKDELQAKLRAAKNRAEVEGFVWELYPNDKTRRDIALAEIDQVWTAQALEATNTVLQPIKTLFQDLPNDDFDFDDMYGTSLQNSLKSAGLNKDAALVIYNLVADGKKDEALRMMSMLEQRLQSMARAWASGGGYGAKSSENISQFRKRLQNTVNNWQADTYTIGAAAER